MRGHKGEGIRGAGVWGVVLNQLGNCSVLAQIGHVQERWKLQRKVQKKKKKERMGGNSREKHVCDVKKSKCGKQAGSECSASNTAGGENKGWFKEHGWELKHTSSGVGYCALVGRYVPVAPLCCQFWIVSERLVPSGRSNPALSTGTALQKKAAFCRGMGTTTMSQ